MRKLLIAGAAAALLAGAVAVSAQTPTAPTSQSGTKAESGADTKAQSTKAQGESKGHSSANQPRDAKGRFVKKDQAAGGSDGKAAQPRDEKGRFMKKDQAGSGADAKSGAAVATGQGGDPQGAKTKAATPNAKASADTKDRGWVKKWIKRGGETVGPSPLP